MNPIAKFVKTTLIGGLLVVVPLWLSVLLLIKAVGALAALIKPITAMLPEQARHPQLIALILLVLVCFLVGLALRTGLGQRIDQFIERNVLQKIPGYTVIRSMVGQLAHSDKDGGFEPALVEIEDALVPGFIVERHPDGRLTTFVPSAPTPALGAIYILTPERVHPVSVTLPKAISCVSKWGAGSGVLLAAMKPNDKG